MPDPTPAALSSLMADGFLCTMQRYRLGLNIGDVLHWTRLVLPAKIFR